MNAAGGVPRVVARALYNRGVATAEEARAFLEGPAEPFHNPNLLPQMVTAVERPAQAIESGDAGGGSPSTPGPPGGCGGVGPAG